MRRSTAAAGVAAGCVLLLPAVASAGAPQPGNPTSMKVTVSGTTVTVTGTCPTEGVEAEASYDIYRGQMPKQLGLMTKKGKVYTRTFTNVAPDYWQAIMVCLDGSNGHAIRRFRVGVPPIPGWDDAAGVAGSTPTKPAPKPTKPKPKPAPQVVVKPQGAPQTGGGPADDDSAVPALVAGGALLLVGAGGAVVLRRRAAARR
ncbi:hypothetical protein SAMN04489727_7039 [Amycolatopsis tolypomycina]|uniref:LPXTG-motif cell wall anchor domain-containing protein n=1 Tax=Amycolatopsis tolypomycina TaxID=208445 RepID=A0A1H4Z3S2_9PSEU|nr:hypothetical protein SAMN04489727_7039 [Amycolatopsis tolypomycina]